MIQSAIDIDALKNRLKATWMAGDFGLIAKGYESGAAEFVRRLGLAPARVLDVACGTGNLAVPAARTGAEVTGVDIATNLLEQARTRAAAEGVKARFDEGDAEATVPARELRRGRQHVRCDVRAPGIGGR